MRTVRFATSFGAALGIGIAVIALSLTEPSPFGITILALCPILFLGSTLYIKSKLLLYLVTIVGNGVIYGILSALVGWTFLIFQRLTTRNYDNREKHS